MLHPEIMRMLADDRIEALKRAATRRSRTGGKPVIDLDDVEIRLCRSADDQQLDELAVLAGRPLPLGRVVVAVVRGRIVAALPLAAGHALTDPFRRTAHLVPLLELRAAQLREPTRRFGVFRQGGVLRRRSVSI